MAALDLTLVREEAGQRAHPLRAVFNGRRYVVKTGAPWLWTRPLSVLLSFVTRTNWLKQVIVQIHRAIAVAGIVSLRRTRPMSSPRTEREKSGVRSRCVVIQLVPHGGTRYGTSSPRQRHDD